MHNYTANTEVLDLSSQNLSTLPKEVVSLKKLKVLFLSHNTFTSIPKEIAALENLEFLGMKSCKLTSIDMDALPKNLRWLTLTDNQITKIPSGISKLTKLEKLLLAGNNIATIPDEIASCKNLALIRIAANTITQSPFDIIKKLPNLAWYGDAGNPFSVRNNTPVTIPEIHWEDLTLESVIGTSAQNKIYKALVNGTNEAVAVKIFGSTITSDGYPQDDKDISILAGKHTNIIETLYAIKNVPENKSAIVLKMVDTEFSNLGLPPNFATCSRDTFATNKNYAIDVILNVLKAVNSACIHLHQNQIMHGDLYAHNIVINHDGNALIGDFGAACVYDQKTEPERELIDVKAFGFLIDDLLNQSFKEKTDTYARLEKLRNLCLSQTIEKRPTFKKIALLLENN